MKKITIALFIFCLQISSMILCMDKEQSALNIAQRCAHFIIWKKNPGIGQVIQNDYTGTVKAYLHLTMYMNENFKTDEEKKSRLLEMAQIAKLLCPSYKFWDEYYLLLLAQDSRTDAIINNGLKNIVIPKLIKIARLKTKINILKGQSDSITPVEWQTETEFLEKKMAEHKTKDLLLVLQWSLDPKLAEIHALRKEYKKLCNQLTQLLHKKNEEIINLDHELDLTIEAGLKFAQIEEEQRNQIKELRIKNDHLQESFNKIQSLCALFDSADGSESKHSFIQLAKKELEYQH